jgi:hypothetical protein
MMGLLLLLCHPCPCARVQDTEAAKQARNKSYNRCYNDFSSQFLVPLIDDLQKRLGPVRMEQLLPEYKWRMDWFQVVGLKAEASGLPEHQLFQVFGRLDCFQYEVVSSSTNAAGSSSSSSTAAASSSSSSLAPGVFEATVNGRKEQKRLRANGDRYLLQQCTRNVEAHIQGRNGMNATALGAITAANDNEHHGHVTTQDFSRW